ncbi:hypothetical protein ACVRWQ_06685 [Streptococcus phocae subsp. salmonis]|uniref:hypothetical protein n=1 Tax=Streptococcus phocae TaxID=119224 RepID=UPI000A954982|nr:hypothetical protein [Streptococcus phocae]
MANLIILSIIVFSLIKIGIFIYYYQYLSANSRAVSRYKRRLSARDDIKNSQDSNG